MSNSSYFSLSTALCFISLHLSSQVTMHYEEYLTGQADISDIAAIT
ncbi:MAG: hypothetical protein R2795_20725 [Saprospiraceae bacterium]